MSLEKINIPEIEPALSDLRAQPDLEPGCCG